jgi:hypothetical protein
MAGGFFGMLWASAVAAEASTINIVARSWDRMGLPFPAIAMQAVRQEIPRGLD